MLKIRTLEVRDRQQKRGVQLMLAMAAEKHERQILKTQDDLNAA